MKNDFNKWWYENIDHAFRIFQQTDEEDEIDVAKLCVKMKLFEVRRQIIEDIGNEIKKMRKDKPGLAGLSGAWEAIKNKVEGK